MIGKRSRAGVRPAIDDCAKTLKTNEFSRNEAGVRGSCHPISVSVFDGVGPITRGLATGSGRAGVLVYIHSIRRRRVAVRLLNKYNVQIGRVA